MPGTTQAPDALRVLSVNTQARRLRYVSVVVDLISTGMAAEPVVVSRLVAWAASHSEALEHHVDRQGRIGDKLSGPRRYLELATRLGVATEVAGSIALARDGRVLSAFIPKAQSDFALQPSERLFYLHTILEKDAEHILCILDRLYSEAATLGELQHEYKESYSRRLTAMMSIRDSSPTRGAFSEALHSVSLWQSPKRYVEHIVPPRLSWLLDLSLLDAKKFSHHLCALSAEGENLVASLPKDETGRNSVINDDWLQGDFFSLVISNWQARARFWSSLEENEKVLLAEVILAEAFRRFGRPILDRIPLRQACLFLSLRASDEGFVVDGKELLEWLSAVGKVGAGEYQVRRAAREREAYLLRVKSR